MDDLDARLKDLGPRDASRWRPLPARAEHHLRTLLEEGQERRRAQRSPLEILSGTIAGVLAVALVVIAGLNLGGTPAQAMTPPPLQFASDDQELDTIIRIAATKLKQSEGPPTPLRGTRHLGWFAQIDMDQEADSPVVIAPEITELTWNEDLSAVQTITAATAYWADASSDASVGDAAPTPGTVISESNFGPGEFAVPSAQAPGDSIEDMRELLMSMGMSETDSGAGEVMEALESAMGLWTLTNRQHAALLQLILDAGDVDVLGTAVDRAGRPVVGLRAAPASFPGTARTLLVSVDSGRIVGIETTRTTAEPPLKAGDVVAYKLWEVSE